MRHLVNNVWLENNKNISLQSHGKRYTGILKITKSKMYVDVHEIQQLDNNERVCELQHEYVRKYFSLDDIENVFEQDDQYGWEWVMMSLK